MPCRVSLFEDRNTRTGPERHLPDDPKAENIPRNANIPRRSKSRRGDGPLAIRRHKLLHQGRAADRGALGGGHHAPTTSLGPALPSRSAQRRNDCVAMGRGWFDSPSWPSLKPTQIIFSWRRLEEIERKEILRDISEVVLRYKIGVLRPHGSGKSSLMRHARGDRHRDRRPRALRAGRHRRLPAAGAKPHATARTRPRCVEEASSTLDRPTATMTPPGTQIDEAADDQPRTPSGDKQASCRKKKKKKKKTTTSGAGMSTPMVERQDASAGHRGGIVDNTFRRRAPPRRAEPACCCRSRPSCSSTSHNHLAADRSTARETPVALRGHAPPPNPPPPPHPHPPPPPPPPPPPTPPTPPKKKTTLIP